MEIVLQWLDELDDIVFAGFSLWPRLRRSCLAVGMTAATGLHVLPPLGVSVEHVLGLAYVAVASVVLWLAVAAISAGTESRERSLTDPA
jgi:hypothetical protein